MIPRSRFWESRYWAVGFTIFFLALILPGFSTPAAAQDIVVESADPAETPQGTVNLDVTITGKGFKKGAVAKFLVTGSETDTGGVTVNSTTFKGVGKLISNITVANDAKVSKFDIEVYSGGRRGKGIELFSVKSKDSSCTEPPPPPPLVPASCLNSFAGCLDSTFGGGTGRVMAPWGLWIYGVTTQPIGAEERTVAVGYTLDDCIANEGLWTVVRYLPDGTLDPSFGNGGIVYEDFKQYSGWAYAVLVQPDNKLVVAGAGGPPSQGQFTVARYNEDGTHDLCFGDASCTSGGMVKVPYSNTWGIAEAVALQSDGKIVVAGIYGYPSRLGVVRLNPNGTLDTSFNGSGQYIDLASPKSTAEAVTLQQIGGEERIVVAGMMLATKPTDSAFLLRLTQTGALDSSFGDSGVVVTDFSITQNYYTGIAVDSSNRLVAAGTASTDDWSEYHLAMARYDQEGNLDPSFGNGGKFLLPSVTSDAAKGLAIQSDGRILVAGSIWSDNVTIPHFGVWRFLENGVLDPYFGNNGSVVTDFASGQSPSAQAMTLQSSDKLVVAGITGGGTVRFGALARYHVGQQVPAHDVSVLTVSPSPSGVTQGEVLNVDVTVANLGMNPESVDVTVTESPDGASLGTQSIVLATGETVTLTFHWATGGSTTPGEHTLQAVAAISNPDITDQRPANNSQSATVSIAPAGSDITLTATGYKVQGKQMVDLEWIDATDVSIFRDGQIVGTDNSSPYTDKIGAKGGGSYNYRVCEIGSGRCSSVVTVTF